MQNYRSGKGTKKESSKVSPSVPCWDSSRKTARFLLLRKRQQSSVGFMITFSPVTTTNTSRSGCVRMVSPPSIRGQLGQTGQFSIFWRTRSIAVTVCFKRPSSNPRSHVDQSLTVANCHSSWWKMCCQQLSPGRNGWQCKNYENGTQGQG